ncbi:hypothetical protein V6N12_057879 [Hibiscus sabdariffa]
MIRRPRKTSPEIVMGELALQMPEMVVDEGLHDSTVVTLVYPKLEIGEEPNRFPRHPSITCLVNVLLNTLMSSICSPTIKIIVFQAIDLGLTSSKRMELEL